MPAEIKGLPLVKALAAFCDPILVERRREIERQAASVPTRWLENSWNSDPCHPLHHGGLVLRRTRPRTWSDTLRSERNQIWNELLADFRRRIASGDVVLVGLQVAPTLAQSKSRIPSVWAGLLKFEVARGAVTARDVKFIHVTAALSKPEAEFIAVGGNVPPPRSVADDVPDRPTRRGGRENFGPLIEEALQARWDDIEARKAIDGKLAWTTMAEMLLRWLKAQYPQRDANGQLPAPRTIENKLSKTYHRLAHDKPAQ
jgi:hypothetical protein